MYRIHYPDKDTPNIVRLVPVVAAIVKKGNIKGLGKSYEALAQEYQNPETADANPETADALAEANTYSAGPLAICLSCLRQTAVTAQCIATVCKQCLQTEQ